MARQYTLITQLQTLVKGTFSIADYTERKRSLADSLAENLKPVLDDDLVGHILHGLDLSYNPFITSFMMRSEATTVDDLIGLLFQEEARMDRDLAR